MENYSDYLADMHYSKYSSPEDVDYAILGSGLRRLPFYEDDLYLGMQAMNIGIVDAIITHQEFDLLNLYIETERTPVDLALTVSAMSQMWIFALYEVLRMWRDRRFQFKKLFESGGIACKINHMESKQDDFNLVTSVRLQQLKCYSSEEDYRKHIESTWEKIEHPYRMIEDFRMNLAKHVAPGKDAAIPRAPGYGRINMLCGSMDYELITKDGFYYTMSRRDIAEVLRNCVVELVNWDNNRNLSV